MATTVFHTVLSGVLVFVLGQIFLKLIIDPINQLKGTIADIAHTLIRYAHALHNPDIISPELRTETYNKLRELSSQLYADMELIPAYRFFGRAFFLPDRTKVYASSKNLIAIANWLSSNHKYQIDHIINNINSLYDNLGLYIDPDDRISEEHLCQDR